jgi:hypothetical protein
MSLIESATIHAALVYSGSNHSLFATNANPLAGLISLDILPKFFNILAGYYSNVQAWNSCCITLTMPPFLDTTLIDLTIVSGE